MKKLLITMTATLLCAGAFGQGKLTFAIDTSRLIYFTTDTTKLGPADANTIVADSPLAGSGLYTGPTYDGVSPGTIMSLEGSPTIIVALYAGISSNSLSLQTTTTIGDFDSEGSVVPVSCTFSSLPSDVPAWFQIQVYDSRANSAADAWNANYYAGVSQVFQATPQLSDYSPLTQATAPVYSTWAAGTFVLVDWSSTYGAIEVYKYNEIPEPPSPSISQVIPQRDGTVILNLSGTPYSTNRLWATASLTPPVVWSPVSTNVASPTGVWQVTDTGAVGWTTRFYRVSMP